MRAILSDIHANLEALQAVLADAAQHGATEIYNLGDTVGYGPNPLECLALAQRFHLNLLGHIDHALLDEPEAFPDPLLQTLHWTLEALALMPDPTLGQRHIHFLTSLSSCHREGTTMYAHGSPRNPRHEYVFPEDIYNDSKMTRIGQAFDSLCFHGHTHIAGLFIHQSPEHWEYLDPGECPDGFAVAGRKVLCNVGSVGQPRDQDPRACYVLFDGATIRFRRVEYDVEATVRKIYDNEQIANFLGDRLREGR